jgi:hypothetical protein
MAKTEQPAYTVQITGLFTFLEDKMTPADLKDALYDLLTRTTPVQFETESVPPEYWQIERDGDTFTASEWKEDDC